MLKINFGQFPVLTTERFVLRRIVETDVEAVFSMRCDDRVMQYLDSKRFNDIEEAHALIKRIDDSFHNNEGITWAISYNVEDLLIGTIGFWRIDKEHHRGEIGYMLHHPYWSKGIMMEVCDVALHYAFNTLDLHSIEGNVNPSNKSSIKLLERLGFVREAYFKENFYYDGQFLDSAIYSLIKPKK